MYLIMTGFGLACQRGNAAMSLRQGLPIQSSMRGRLLRLLAGIVLRIHVVDPPRADRVDLDNRILIDGDLMHHPRRRGVEAAGGEEVRFGLIDGLTHV